MPLRLQFTVLCSAQYMNAKYLMVHPKWTGITESASLFFSLPVQAAASHRSLLCLFPGACFGWSRAFQSSVCTCSSRDLPHFRSEATHPQAKSCLHTIWILLVSARCWVTAVLHWTQWERGVSRVSRNWVALSWVPHYGTEGGIYQSRYRQEQTAWLQTLELTEIWWAESVKWFFSYQGRCLKQIRWSLTEKCLFLYTDGTRTWGWLAHGEMSLLDTSKLIWD